MNGHTLHVLDYAIIILSLLLTLFYGRYFASRQTSTNAYYAGSQSLPPWVVGISILATLISSITFLAYPGEGFKSNWILLMQAVMVVVVLSGLVWFVVPLYRKAIRISAYEYFEKRFGPLARFYSSLAFALTHFSKMGTVFFLLGLALTRMTGLDPYLVVWVTGLAIIYVTLKGGIEAVIWLDVLQGFMLIAGGVISLAVILFSVDGGPIAIINYALEHGKIGFGPYDWDFTRLTFVVMVFNGIFYGIQKYGTDQTIVQRYLTTETEKGAIKAALTGIYLSLPVWALFMFIGTALFAYYHLSANPLPPKLNPDAVFPHFIITVLPPGVIGLVLAALLAAAISSLDSDLNCLSAIAVDDYYTRLRPHSTDAERLRFGKLVVIISGLASLLIATLYVYTGSEGVLGIVFGLYAIFSGGIAGIFLLGVFSRRANKQGLYIAIVACILFTAYAVLSSTKIGGKIILDLGRWNFRHHSYMLGVYTHLVIIVVGYVASLFFKSDRPHDELTIYAWWDKLRSRDNVTQGVTV